MPILLLLAASLALRKRALERLRQLAGGLRKPTTDRFGLSLQELAVSLLMAAIWPIPPATPTEPLSSPLDGTPTIPAPFVAAAVAIAASLLRSMSLDSLQVELG